MMVDRRLAGSWKPWLVLAALLLAACRDSDPYRPPGTERPGDDTPPQAALIISFDDVVVEGYAYTKFSCNPLGSRDDYTPRHELGARWDWENDGEWDTPFRPLAYESGFVPVPLPAGRWSAKCEVRDEAGHIVGVADTVSLPDPWYRAPDLVARRANLDTIGNYSTTDTVRVGQPFLIMANHLRWTEADTPGAMSIDLYLDGVMVQRSRHFVAPNLHWGSDCDADFQYGTSEQTVGAAGVHTITVVVDAANEFAETDETNNTHTRTFVAVE